MCPVLPEMLIWRKLPEIGQTNETVQFVRCFEGDQGSQVDFPQIEDLAHHS